jgi:hypothetical protein
MHGDQSTLLTHASMLPVAVHHGQWQHRAAAAHILTYIMALRGGVQLVWGIGSLGDADGTPTNVLVQGLQRLSASGLFEVDVARIYGENMLQRALDAAPLALSRRILVNSKASVRTHRDDTVLSYAGILRQMKLSLNELGRGIKGGVLSTATQRSDLVGDKHSQEPGPGLNVYYLHQPDLRPGLTLDDALRAVNELHEQGCLKEFGLSNFPA